MKNTYNTKLKKSIYELFSLHQDRLFSAAEVHKALCGGKETPNLTTVYRNLDKMTDEGVLLRFTDSERGASEYKFSGEGCHEHIHLKCTACGEVVHLDCDFMEEVKEHTKKSHGFSISCTESVLLGRCEKCTRETNAKENKRKNDDR